MHICKYNDIGHLAPSVVMLSAAYMSVIVLNAVVLWVVDAECYLCYKPSFIFCIAMLSVVTHSVLYSGRSGLIVMLVVVMLSVIMMNVIKMSVIAMNVIMLSVMITEVVMLNVTILCLVSL